MPQFRFTIRRLMLSTALVAAALATLFCAIRRDFFRDDLISPPGEIIFCVIIVPAMTAALGGALGTSWTWALCGFIVGFAGMILLSCASAIAIHYSAVN